MTKGIRIAVSFAVGLLLNAATVAPVSAQTTVERMAREAAAELAPSLPMRVNQNLTLQTVFPAGSMVTITGLFSYTKADLDEVLARVGKTNEEALAAMRNSAEDAMCMPGSLARRFVIMGGAVRYLYRFSDGTTYTVIDVSSCS